MKSFSSLLFIYECILRVVNLTIFTLWRRPQSTFQVSHRDGCPLTSVSKFHWLIDYSGSVLCEHTNSHIANKMAMLLGQITKNKLQNNHVNLPWVVFVYNARKLQLAAWLRSLCLKRTIFTANLCLFLWCKWRKAYTISRLAIVYGKKDLF